MSLLDVLAKTIETNQETLKIIVNKNMLKLLSQKHEASKQMRELRIFMIKDCLMTH